MHVLRVFIVLQAFVWALTGTVLQAQSRGLPVLREERHVEWTAIGRVNKAAYAERSSCSGTLIASDKVLTAAHCVMGPEGTQRPFDNIHFVAGWLKGSYVWHSTAQQVEVDPNYRKTKDRNGLASDMAVITLKKPAPVALIPPLPLIPVSEQAGDFAIIGYQRTRSNMLSARFDCPKLRDFGATVLIDCPVVGGLSGSPLLEKTNEGWAVSGVVVARTGKGNDTKAFAVWPNAWLLDILGKETVFVD